MQKRKLRDLEVSAVGIGCMGFSHGYGKVPEESYSIKAIQKAYEIGCTFFDTAEAYGKEMFFEGHNEQLVGKAVEPFRKDAVLATKFFIDKSEYGKGSTLHEAILKHLVKSLKNLKTDYADLYYLHRINEEIAVEEIAEVMGRLIKSGTIRGWGLSQVGLQSLKTAHEVTPVSAVQNLYSILERDCEEEIFPYCLENSIGVVPFSPTGSGFLSGKVTTKSDLDRKSVV